MKLLISPHYCNNISHLRRKLYQKNFLVENPDFYLFQDPEDQWHWTSYHDVRRLVIRIYIVYILEYSVMNQLNFSWTISKSQKSLNFRRIQVSLQIVIFSWIWLVFAVICPSSLRMLIFILYPFMALMEKDNWKDFIIT